jgi:hypothetical protein
MAAPTSSSKSARATATAFERMRRFRKGGSTRVRQPTCCVNLKYVTEQISIFGGTLRPMGETRKNARSYPVLLRRRDAVSSTACCAWMSHIRREATSATGTRHTFRGRPAPSTFSVMSDNPFQYERRAFSRIGVTPAEQQPCVA